jgi:hypothetical protein
VRGPLHQFIAVRQAGGKPDGDEDALTRGLRLMAKRRKKLVIHHLRMIPPVAYAPIPIDPQHRLPDAPKYLQTKP